MPNFICRLSVLGLAGTIALGGCEAKARETAATAALSALPACEALAPVNLSNRGTANCSLAATDGSGLVAEVRYLPSDTSSVQLNLDLKSSDGQTFQTLTADVEDAYGLPSFSDLDGDGRAEILMPLMTGNVNTFYAIWRGDDGDPTFSRAGEIGGLEISALEDGMFVASARGSADTWYTSYYIFRNKLVYPIATAQITLLEDGETETCTVTDDGGLGEIGLTLEAAQARFCSAG